MAKRQIHETDKEFQQRQQEEIVKTQDRQDYRRDIEALNEEAAVQTKVREQAEEANRETAAGDDRPDAWSQQQTDAADDRPDAWSQQQDDDADDRPDAWSQQQDDDADDDRPDAWSQQQDTAEAEDEQQAGG